ncbi:hypothetical protein [Nostoc sp. NMS4]|nr:hypothetical protein [Nostoc sp. NMS4]
MNTTSVRASRRYGTQFRGDDGKILSDVSRALETKPIFSTKEILK